MPPRLKRRLLLSALSALLAAGALVGCWLLPGLIPAHWHKPSRVASQLSLQTYLTPGSNRVNYLQMDVQFAAQGEGLQTSTHITATFTDRAYAQTPSGNAVRGDRAEALHRIRNEFPSLCAAAGYEGAAPHFDAIVAAGKNGLTVDFPERRRAAILMSIRSYVIFAAGAALIVAAPLTLYFLAVAIKSRWNARPNSCGSCGYSLTGLTANALCPECGSNVEADRVRFIAPSGKVRRTAGWATLLFGVALTVVWFASVKGDPRGLRLITHTSDDQTSTRELRLIGGGVRFQNVTRPPAGSPGALAPTPFMGQAIQLTVDDFNSPPDTTTDLPTVPDDWSLWRYKTATVWLTMTSFWLSLWPIALLTLIAGAILIAAGYRARKRAP